MSKVKLLDVRYISTLCFYIIVVIIIIIIIII